MSPDRQLHQIKVHESHRGEGLDFFTPVVNLSLKHHGGDSTIWIGFTPILWENTLEVVKDLRRQFPFHQLHERTCGSTAIKITPMPRRHYTFTNTLIFSGIRTQDLRHRSQPLTTMPDEWLAFLI
ncbi:hypothetical protein TNCV_2767381 [Trichonephila clavipes]|nr:hypothetical protein TNCV_2767381 [Trichonephila clavipes]